MTDAADWHELPGDFVQSLLSAAAGTSAAVSLAGREILLLNARKTGDAADAAADLRAYENRCPHRDLPLAGADWFGDSLACPHHGWEFDAATGAGLTAKDSAIAVYAVRRHEGRWQVALPTDPEPEGPRVLVRYGRPGWVSVFRDPTGPATAPPTESFRRPVLVETPRGREVGERLGPAVATDGEPIGTVLPGVPPDPTPTDDLVALAEARLAEVPDGHPLRAIAIADAEWLPAGGPGYLYFLGESTTALGPIASELSRATGRPVEFLPLVDPPPPPRGCGTGCGSCG